MFTLIGIIFISIALRLSFRLLHLARPQRYQVASTHWYFIAFLLALGFLFVIIGISMQ